MSKKKAHHTPINKHKNTDEQNKNRLFSHIDGKFAQISTHTFDNQTPTNQPLIPTGVVDIDKSVENQIKYSNSPHQHHTKPKKIIETTQKDDEEYLHIPHIYHHYDKYNRYEYREYDNYHSINNKDESLNNNLYRYDRYGETYDPRWWYMPINSVHGPKSHRQIDYHYVTPKWYQLQNR
ncbi:unnamed protein product [Rotaria sordida]|uniref:Uncharacterized protein n=1 Tax=Rotaria sordida TaxID=392033 RepID=A0A813Z0T7_9BILA|nr:unnamed protein product [Rotaria sordida]CAF0891758.1 unnamed protein product [Rotaria sordida]